MATIPRNVDGYEKHAMPKPHPVSSASHLKERARLLINTDEYDTFLLFMIKESMKHILT